VIDVAHDGDDRRTGFGQSLGPGGGGRRGFALGEQRLGIVELGGDRVVTEFADAVSWSSTWLIVTIWPSFISTLMTSAALTDILWARSATVIVSGTDTSRTVASAGAAACAPSPSSRPCLRCPFGPRQAPVPPEESPRVLS
jgi:hypothetical protein